MFTRILVVASVSLLMLWGAQSFADDVKPGTHEGKVVKAEVGKLTMTDKDGKNEHSHAIPAEAKITCDDKECKLTDLKAGYPVKVTVEQKGDKSVVTKVEAKKA